MEGNIRFQTSFRNVLNRLYVINIIDTSFRGEPTLYMPNGSGFSLNYEPDSDTKLTNAIITSRCIIPVRLEFKGTSIRTEWNAFLQDLLGSGDEIRFQIEIIEDGNTFWKGLINIEQISIPDRLYDSVEITATDGLGILSSKPYDNDGTLYTGWETIIGHLHNCLSKLMLGMGYKVVQNWSNGINDAFRFTRCNHDAFKEVKGDTTLPIDCLSVIKQILTRFQCRIIQRGGEWWIEQYNYIVENPRNVNSFDSTATFLGTTVDTFYTNAGRQLAGGSTTYREQAKNATSQYFYTSNLNNNLFNGLVPQNTPQSIGVITSGNHETISFNFEFLVNHIGRKLNDIEIRFRIKFIFTVVQGGKWLSNAGGNWVWTDSALSNVVIYSINVYTDWSSITNIEKNGFITPETVTDGEVTITWTYDLVHPETHSHVHEFGETSIQNINNFCALITDVAESYEGTKVVTASSGNGTGELVNTDAIIIGDGPAERSIGKLQALDNFYGIWIDTKEWSVVAGETAMSIDHLLARELMAMQKKTVEVKNLNIRGVVEVSHTIGGCIITSATYEANKSEWNVSGFRPLIDRTGITFIDYIDSEQTGSLPGGVNPTPSDPIEQYWQRNDNVLSPVIDGDTVQADNFIGLTGSFGDLSAAESRVGVDNNYVQTTKEGHIILHGRATYWTDLRTPGQAMYKGSANDPTFGTWIGGLRAWKFSDTKAEELFFMLQMPHSWLEGSTIHPHVHWFPDSSQANPTRVKWGLEYTWFNWGDTAPITTTIYSTDIQPAQNPVGYRHYVSFFNSISGLGKLHSSQITCRLFRLPADPADTLVGSAGLLEFDFHIENDSMGSNGILSKYTSDPDLIKYGLLYNFYAATDARKITRSDTWVVPNDTQWNSLITYLGGYLIAGGKLKEIGLTYWSSPNTDATNMLNYNWRGNGYRTAGGFFGWLNEFGWVLSSSLYGGTLTTPFSCRYNDARLWSWGGGYDRGYGAGIRLFRSATPHEQLLTDGTACEGYVQNDGKVIRTVKIGTQVWLADNLAETKFRNGDWIHGFDNGDYTPISNAEWGALETAGCCAYNDDLSNV